MASLAKAARISSDWGLRYSKLDSNQSYLSKTSTLFCHWYRQTLIVSSLCQLGAKSWLNSEKRKKKNWPSLVKLLEVQYNLSLKAMHSARNKPERWILFQKNKSAGSCVVKCSSSSLFPFSDEFGTSVRESISLLTKKQIKSPPKIKSIKKMKKKRKMYTQYLNSWNCGKCETWLLLIWAEAVKFEYCLFKLNVVSV